MFFSHAFLIDWISATSSAPKKKREREIEIYKQRVRNIEKPFSDWRALTIKTRKNRLLLPYFCLPIATSCRICSPILRLCILSFLRKIRAAVVCIKPSLLFAVKFACFNLTATANKNSNAFKRNGIPSSVFLLKGPKSTSRIKSWRTYKPPSTQKKTKNDVKHLARI